MIKTSVAANDNIIMFAKDAGVLLEGASSQLSHLHNNDIFFSTCGVSFRSRLGVSHFEDGRICLNKTAVQIENCDSHVVVEGTEIVSNEVAVLLKSCTESVTRQHRDRSSSVRSYQNRRAPSGAGGRVINLTSASSGTNQIKLYHNNEGPHLLRLKLLKNQISVFADASRVQMRACCIDGGLSEDYFRARRGGSDDSNASTTCTGILAENKSCVRVYGTAAAEVVRQPPGGHQFTNKAEHSEFLESASFVGCCVSKCVAGIHSSSGAVV